MIVKGERPLRGFVERMVEKKKDLNLKK